MAKYNDSVTGSKFVGKEVNTVACSLPFPIVDDTAIHNKAHPVNITELSGKQVGAMILSTNHTNQYELCIANGSGPTDTWTVMKFAGAAITPVKS